MQFFKKIMSMPKTVKQTIHFYLKLHLQGYFINKTITTKKEYKTLSANHNPCPLKNHLKVHAMTHLTANLKMKVNDKNGKEKNISIFFSFYDLFLIFVSTCTSEDIKYREFLESLLEKIKTPK